MNTQILYLTVWRWHFYAGLLCIPFVLTLALAGNAGSVLAELAGNWAIVLILSGLYLRWPRDRRGNDGIRYPRLASVGRLFWRDLHAVLGFWVSAFALFLLLTGLPWTLVWNS